MQSSKLSTEIRTWLALMGASPRPTVQYRSFRSLQPIGVVIGDVTGVAFQRKLSIRAAESRMWSPSSKMMKWSVTSSPGVTGELVVSQPVEPPGIEPPKPKPPPGGSSKPVPEIPETGCLQFCVCGFELSFSQTTKKPLLTVTGFFCMSNAILVRAPPNSALDSWRTRNSSLNSVQTYIGYSAEKNWKSNEKELALEGAFSLTTSSV